MLIEFSVANFRSFKGKQTLSMVASRKPNKPLRAPIASGFKAAPELLESVAIYGPNGSGKSNLIKAMRFFQHYVELSFRDTDKKTIPFLFSKETPKQPSEFEIIFLHNDYLYQYGFILDGKRVHSEWLYATPQGSEKEKAQKWLFRNGDEPMYISPKIKGEKETWKGTTTPDSLLLSTAIGLNAKTLKPVADWIVDHLKAIPASAKIPAFHTAEQGISSPEDKKRIMNLMKTLDVSFDDYDVEDMDVESSEIPSEIRERARADGVESKKLRISRLVTIYNFGKSRYKLNFDQESDGTKALFSYAWPLLDVLDKGWCLVVDELQMHLHPHAMRGVISLFQNPKMNTKGAQLIFTTHDTNAMKLMDHEQIWLVDKNKEGASQLFSIGDFKDAKPDDAIEKRYLAGRYGALPNIGKVFE